MTTSHTTEPDRSTGGLLAAHDASRRAVARKTGTTVPRMSNVEFTLFADAHRARVIYTDQAGHLRLLTDTTDEPLSDGHLNQIGVEYTNSGAPFDFRVHEAKVHGRVPVHTVFADPPTRNRVMRRLARQADNDDKLAATHRRALWLSDMPAGSILGTLTAMLGRRFWLPTGMDPDNLADWSVAQGGIRAVTGETIHRLIKNGAAPDRRRPNSTQRSLMRSVLSMSVSGCASYVYRGIEPYNRAYKFADAVANAWNGAEAVDVLLAERNVIAGRVVRITPAGDTGESLRWKVADGRVDFKPDSPLVAFTENRLEETSFMGAELVGDDTFVTVAAGTLHSDRPHPITLVRDDAVKGLDAFAATKPFAMYPRGKTTRWTRALERSERKRDIPLDVVVAGAPAV